MVASKFEGMCASHCAVWNGLTRLVTERHGVNFDSLAFIRLNDDEIGEAMRALRAACEALGTSELFGPDDATIMAAVGNRSVQLGFNGSPNASPEEIRLAWIFRHCERYVFERSEVCPTWIKPFPSEPVNTISALTTYLRTAIAEWSEIATENLDPAVPVTERWRVLDNAQHTLAWLHRRGEILSVP